MQLSRSSGILLHPTSLPGSFGIGDFGDEARAFVDFLAASGQRLWQVLPLGPTGDGNSPYQGLSAFAGNTLLIDPDRLVADGLLATEDLEAAPSFNGELVDYAQVQAFKSALLWKAFENFKHQAAGVLGQRFAGFCEHSSRWLDDYSLFCALKDAHGGVQWTDWDAALANREPAALAEAGGKLRKEIDAHKFFQFLFFEQWNALRNYCHQRGVRVIGDLPIFVAHDSADVWVNPAQFKLDRNGRPPVVAGVPPDYYSATGQVWNSPLYDWDHMLADGFTFWISKLRAALQLADIVRIDHFRGFAACWEIPAGATNAIGGQWVATPGKELFRALRLALGNLPIIAEDLGEITPDVTALLDSFGFPGMRVMQFGFGRDLSDIHLPHNYSKNVVAYTATHDSNTTLGWFDQIGDQERAFCLQYLNSDGKEIHWDFINALLASAAEMVIVPLQDVLGLGSEARMNVPNTSTGNWAWRYRPGELVDEIGRRLKQSTELHRR